MGCTPLLAATGIAQSARAVLHSSWLEARQGDLLPVEYGLLANAERRASLATARALLNVSPPEPSCDESTLVPAPTFACRCCGAMMRVVEIMLRRLQIRAPP